MKEMTAYDRFLERQRIANERAIEMYGKAIEDALVGGTGITKDGKRIDPADFYAAPVADRAFLERVLASMEGVIDVADRATDEFYALRSCVVDLTVMLHTPPTQPAQQEPVAWMHVMDNTEGIKANGKGIVSITQKRKHPFGKPGVDFSKSYPVTSTPLYTTPPAAQKPWVGLTDSEVMQTMGGDWTSQFYFARAIESKLREKNGGAS
jgi:hypothetical protein